MNADDFSYRREPEPEPESVRFGDRRPACVRCRFPIDDAWEAWVVSPRGAMVHSACWTPPPLVIRQRGARR